MDGSNGNTAANSLMTPTAPNTAISSSSNQSSPESFNGGYNSKSPDILSRSFNLTHKLMSPAASSGPFCRICHEGDHKEDLVSLCKCTGSVGMMHLSCMERWLNTKRNNSDKCEICNYSFDTVRSPKSLLEWYRSDQSNMCNGHGILCYIACFFLITPLAAVSAFLCLKGAKRQVNWNTLESDCLIVLAIFLVTIYIGWNILTFRYHYQSFMRWRSVNQNVRLVHHRRKSTSTENPVNPNIPIVQQNGNNRRLGETASATVNPVAPTTVTVLSDSCPVAWHTSNFTLRHT